MVIRVTNLEVETLKNHSLMNWLGNPRCKKKKKEGYRLIEKSSKKHGIKTFGSRK
jgi:hypothetical protein